MNSAMKDDVWKRRGISVLWDGNTMAKMDAASSVISLRRFFELFEESWPEEKMPLVKGRALIVAGVDVSIDALNPEAAIKWMEDEVYPKIYDFQSWAGSDFSLVLWMADQNRWKENTSANTYEWLLGGKQKGELFPIGRCIWNGAQNDVRHIEAGDQAKWIGLYLERIS
jgi:hypothetical protein